MAIEVISGELEFNTNTIIFEQEYLIRSYLSIIIFRDSFIHSINVIQNHLKILTSNLTMENMEIHSISTTKEGIFINLAFQSIFTLQNITYYDSKSILAQTSGSSTAFLTNLTFINITEANDLLKFQQ